MIHPNTEVRFISPDMGYGVVATEFIPMGTITWVLDKLDREFSPAEVLKMDQIYQGILDTYTYRNNKGNYVLCWDHGRYVNHSFHANCLTTAYDFEIAVRDIHPGEQLTDDYGYLNITAPFEGIPEKGKRKIVYPDDLLRYHKQWDRKLQKAFRRVPLVQQALQTLFSKDQWERIQRVSRGNETMESILSCYYDVGQRT